MLLAIPGLYNLFQHAVGARRACRRIVREHLRPRAGDRILDIGCGTGEILRYLPPCEYVGFDVNPDYIAYARRHFGGRGVFRCECVSQATLQDLPPFDLAVAYGVLHHLDDAQVDDLIALAHAALRPGGRFLSVDPVFCERQSLADRWFTRLDRGGHVRNPDEHRRMASRLFPGVRVEVVHGILFVPASGVIVDCPRGGA